MIYENSPGRRAPRAFFPWRKTVPCVAHHFLPLGVSDDNAPMPTGRDNAPSAPDAVADAFLLASAASGDRPAFLELMRRYDRLVRYTILRLSGEQTRRDPQWLDSLASAVWAGFARSIRGADRAPITNLPSYLIQITRNLCLAELRREVKAARAVRASQAIQAEEIERMADPAAIQQDLELLDRLRACLAELPESEQPLVSQLRALLDRHWEEAARNLGMAESTLRSRWPRFLQGLRERLSRKTGVNFAPDSSDEHS